MTHQESRKRPNFDLGGLKDGTAIARWLVIRSATSARKRAALDGGHAWTQVTRSYIDSQVDLARSRS